MGMLNFYTEGVGFTNLIQTYIREGRFRAAYKMFGSNGLSDEQIGQFFKNNARFTGNSEDGNFSYKIGVSPDEPITDEDLFYAVNTLLSAKKISWLHFKKSNEEELFYFDKFYSREKIWNDFQYEIITRLLNFEAEVTKTIGDTGILLDNGLFIHCLPTEHEYYFSLLYQLGIGLVEGPDRSSCDKSVHVSSGTLNGKRILNINDRIKHWSTLSQEQFDALAKQADELTIYSYRSGKLGHELLEAFGENLNQGGKYNNLAYIKKYMPNIKTPEIQLERPENVEGWCIRTSPKKSMAGLLHSVFNITDDSEQYIEQTFERYKDVIEGNELHYFYQKIVEGITGVAHYKKGEFTYACSENRHDIVDGKESTVKLTDELEAELHSIMKYLYEYFNCLIQVEFTVNDANEIIVLQLRLMVMKDMSYANIDTAKMIYKGKSFYSGKIELTKDELLIATNDLPSEALVGKKGLVVINGDEFSHLLALSYSLKIPSMQMDSGDLEILPEKFVLDTRNETGYILSV